MLKQSVITSQIKEFATSIGFDACGICVAEDVAATGVNNFQNWLNNKHNADMHYMEQYPDKRFSPQQLVENAKSIICVALNYYPENKQPEDVPQFAYYAYGKDYHDVMKAKLNQLLAFIQTLIPNAKGRAFCDTAPVMERYWAAKAGLGFIGKNSLLIIPRKGSFFFLGELILDIELNYDSPLHLSCGSCTRCLDACPTKAIEKPFVINSNKCISYQTIENRKEIDAIVATQMNNCVYGCDICQKTCPWNKFSTPHRTEEFIPRKEFLKLDLTSLQNLTIEEYRKIFKGSAVKRAKYEGLKRNIATLAQK